MTSPSPDTGSRWLLVVLASVVALGPLTIDMYLPALPAIGRDLAADPRQVQLTISSFLLGFAIFHLACGPLADRYGRKPIILGGLLLYLAAALGCATAGNIEQLILWRFLQGIGACVGPTLGRAIARDVFGPRRSARALAQIAMIMALAPAVAPAMGGLLLEFFGWPVIFYSLFSYAALVILVVLFLLQESLPEVQPLHPLHIGRNYLQLLRSPHFVMTSCSSSLIYAGMVSYLSASSFVLIDMMGVPERYFGLLFFSIVIGYISGSAISTRLIHGRESEQVMWIGVQISVCAALAILVLPEIWFHPVSLVLPMTVFSTSLGVILPHAMAAALRPFPQMAGTASALMGFVQMGLSSVAGAIVGALLADTARPMGGVMLAASLVSWGLIAALQRRQIPA